MWGERGEALGDGKHTECYDAKYEFDLSDNIKVEGVLFMSCNPL